MDCVVLGFGVPLQKENVSLVESGEAPTGDLKRCLSLRIDLDRSSGPGSCQDSLNKRPGHGAVDYPLYFEAIFRIDRPLAPLEPREKLVWLCGQNTANINPEKPLKLNLDDVYEIVKQRFKVRLKSRLAIIFDYGDLEISLFNGGRMLIKNVKNEKAALKALSAYKNILKKLNIKQ